MRLIDGDALEREGWSLCRTFQKDKDTMVYEVKKPSDFPAIEPERTGKWIPCSERFPEDGDWCLFTDGVSMSVERYKADALDHFFPEGRWFSLEDAVAWMPLPEPYYPNCGARMEGNT